MSAVDLTKCQPGDRLRMRNGDTAVYCGNDGGKWMQHIFCPVHCGHTEFAHDNGSANDSNYEETDFDIVAIIHPTRAELEEQRRELLAALSRLMACIDSQDATEADFSPAQMQARKAIARAEATHE